MSAHWGTVKHGFTLLEIIITVIILTIFLGLALPKYVEVVEFSRSQEALSHLLSIRKAMNRCYLFDNNYSSCSGFANLDIEDPSTSSTGLFSYSIATTPTAFTITALRNTRAGGDGTSIIALDIDGTKFGTGPFSNIR